RASPAPWASGPAAWAGAAGSGPSPVAAIACSRHRLQRPIACSRHRLQRPIACSRRRGGLPWARTAHPLRKELLMGLPIKLRHVPPRLAAGAFILNSGLNKRDLDEESAAGLQSMAAQAFPQHKDM